MAIGRLTAEDTFDLYRRHFPRGPFWAALLGRGRSLWALVMGWAEEAARGHNRVIDAREDLHTATATETIACWEASLGLPDVLYQAGADLPARRQQATAKLASPTGSGPDHYVHLAALLGAEVAVSAPYWPALTNEARADDPAEQPDAKFTWRVEGDVAIDAQERLEALYLVYMPAHCNADYVYTIT